MDLVGLVTYRGGIQARRRSPIPVLTGPNVEQLRSCDERRYRYAKPPSCLYLLQSSTVMLLQELLSYQDKFGSHYMAGLEGCGPSLEADVHSSYYALIQQLVSACRTVRLDCASRSLNLFSHYLVMSHVLNEPGGMQG